MFENSESQINQVVADILDSYQQVGGINYTNGLNLPSKQRIIDIWQMLRTVLFPGFYEREQVDETSLPYLIGRARCTGTQKFSGRGQQRHV